MRIASQDRAVMLLSLLVTIVPVSRAKGGTVTITPAKDNTIFLGNIASSNALGVLYTGRTFEGNVRRCLLAFDVAGAVPAGSTINSATLTLNLQQASAGSGAQNHTLHRLLHDWGQGTSESSSENGGAATIGDATWAYRFFPFPDMTWDNFGGDFDPIASAARMVGTDTGAYTWGSTPKMVQDVQEWLDDSGGSYGWILVGNEVTAQTTRVFTNLEDANALLRPQLALVYDPPVCDLNGDDMLDAADLALLLGAWGHNPGHPADLNGDDLVNAADLALLLGSWGPCR